MAAHSLGIGYIWINGFASICDEPEVLTRLEEYEIPKQDIVYATMAMRYPQSEGKLLAKK